MESLQALKARRHAVKNIGQITKAMEVVAATKMRRAQEVALASRPFAYSALELLGRVTKHSPHLPSLSVARPVLNTLLVIVASDRGLAGPFNAQILRAVEGFRAADKLLPGNNHHYLAIAVGKKAIGYAAKQGLPLVEAFTGFGDYATPEEVAPLAHAVIEGFRDGRWDRAVAISMHFRTTLRQDPLVRQILPVDFLKISETVGEILPERGRYAESRDATARGNSQPKNKSLEYIFEPSADAVLEKLVPALVAMQLWHLLLEANASEHSARRVAMKNASDNAAELAENLAIEYNKARQAGITKELIEISATQNAMAG